MLLDVLNCIVDSCTALYFTALHCVYHSSPTPIPAPRARKVQLPQLPTDQIDLLIQILQIARQTGLLVEAAMFGRIRDHLADHELLLFEDDQALAELFLFGFHRGHFAAADDAAAAAGMVIAGFDGCERTTAFRWKTLVVWSGVFEDLGQRAQRQHVQAEETVRLLVDGCLEFLLGRGGGGEVADAFRGCVELGESFHEALADFGCVGELLRGGGLVGVLQGGEELLEAREEEADAALELGEVLVGALVFGFGGCLAVEVAAAEEGVRAVLAHAHVDAHLVGGGFLGLGRVDVEPDLRGACSSRVAADDSPAHAAMVPSKGVGGELLLAEGTMRDFCVVFPRDDGLLECLALVLRRVDANR